MRYNTASVPRQVHTPNLSAFRKEPSDATTKSVHIGSSSPATPMNMSHRRVAVITLAPDLAIALLLLGAPKPAQGRFSASSRITSSLVRYGISHSEAVECLV